MKIKSLHHCCLCHQGIKALVSHTGVRLRSEAKGLRRRTRSQKLRARARASAGEVHSKLLRVGRGRRQDASNGAEARKGQGRPRKAHDVGTAFQGARGPGEVAKLPSGGFQDLFTTRPLESSAGISRPGAVRQTGRPSCCSGSPQDARKEGGREEESRGHGHRAPSPSEPVRTRKTASSLLGCACLRPGLRVNLPQPLTAALLGRRQSGGNPARLHFQPARDSHLLFGGVRTPACFPF